MMLLTGCQSYYAPKRNESASTIKVVNQSSVNLGMAIYGKPSTCEEASWLFQEKNISPNSEKTTQIDSEQLTTILFTSGNLSNTTNGVVLTTHKHSCYIALSFTPNRLKEYRFLYDASTEICSVISEVKSNNGDWIVNQNIFKRDTSGFSYEKVSPCQDQL